MNLVALVLLLLTLNLFTVSCVDAGKVLLMVSNITLSFEDMEANFLKDSVETGVVYVAEPLDACEKLRNKPEANSTSSPFVLIERGGCSYEHKVRNAQRSGFKAAIVYDNVYSDILFAMGGDSDGIEIQAVFVSKAAGETLKKYAGLGEAKVVLVPGVEDSASYATIAWRLSVVMFVVLSISVFVYRQCIAHRNIQFHGMIRRKVKELPSVTFAKDNDKTPPTCAICLQDYSVGDKLRILPCSHMFHAACVDSWLTLWKTICPVCKRDAFSGIDEPPASEITPLLRSSTATSSVVVIDLPPLRSSVVSSSYIQQVFMSRLHTQ